MKKYLLRGENEFLKKKTIIFLHYVPFALWINKLIYLVNLR